MPAKQKAAKGIPGSASNKTKQASHARYASEDRAWWARAGRLIYLIRRAQKSGKTALATERKSVWSDVFSRAEIHLRTRCRDLGIAPTDM